MTVLRWTIPFDLHISGNEKQKFFVDTYQTNFELCLPHANKSSSFYGIYSSFWLGLDLQCGHSKITWRVVYSFPWPNLLGWLLQCDDVRLPRTVGQADRPRGAHVPAPARPEHLLQRGEAFLWLSLSFSLAFCCFPLVFLIFSSFPLGFLLTFLLLSYGFPCDIPLAFLSFSLAFLKFTFGFLRLKAFLRLSYSYPHACLHLAFSSEAPTWFHCRNIKLNFSYIKGPVLEGSILVLPWPDRCCF